MYAYLPHKYEYTNNSDVYSTEICTVAHPLFLPLLNCIKHNWKATTEREWDQAVFFRLLLSSCDLQGSVDVGEHFLKVLSVSCWPKQSSLNTCGSFSWQQNGGGLQREEWGDLRDNQSSWFIFWFCNFKPLAPGDSKSTISHLSDWNLFFPFLIYL